MNQRHRDLKTNELEKLVSSAGPWFEQHGNKLIYAVCAAMLCFSLYYYLNTTSADQNSAGWSAFIAASEPDDFAAVASSYKGSPPGQWALLAQANENLESGIRASFSDREGAISDLKSAQEKFEELLKDPKISPELEERALFGQARCLESLAGKDTSKPAEAYEALLEKYPDSIFKKVAEAQIEALNAKDGQEFYAWFVAQNPSPTQPGTPFDGLPAGHPEVNPGSLVPPLPEIPDILKLQEDSAPAFPEGLGTSDTESSVPPPPPTPVDGEGTAPPLPENSQP